MSITNSAHLTARLFVGGPRDGEQVMSPASETNLRVTELPKYFSCFDDSQGNTTEVHSVTVHEYVAENHPKLGKIWMHKDPNGPTRSRFLIQYPHWRCWLTGEVVQALRIERVIPNPRGLELHFADHRFTPFQVATDWFDPGNFVVPAMVTADGYLVMIEGRVPQYIASEIFLATHETCRAPQ